MNASKLSNQVLSIFDGSLKMCGVWCVVTEDDAFPSDQFWLLSLYLA